MSRNQKGRNFCHSHLAQYLAVSFNRDKVLHGDLVKETLDITKILLKYSFT